MSLLKPKRSMVSSVKIFFKLSNQNNSQSKDFKHSFRWSKKSEGYCLWLRKWKCLLHKQFKEAQIFKAHPEFSTFIWEQRFFYLLQWVFRPWASERYGFLTFQYLIIWFCIWHWNIEISARKEKLSARGSYARRELKMARDIPKVKGKRMQMKPMEARSKLKRKHFEGKFKHYFWNEHIIKIVICW